MLSFLAPAWLAGLVLVPVIRWLHRGGRHRMLVPVSRLALWRDANANSTAPGARKPPDPAWRRRALLYALLLLALAEPHLPQQRTAITIWVDDSISMLTQEMHGTQGTRLAAGLAQARALLAAVPRAEVAVRTLGDPWRRVDDLGDANIAMLTDGAGRRSPAAPPGPLLTSDRLHWLITDGAEAALFEWSDNRRPDRVIQVGSVTHNVGLTRLSARRTLSDPARYDLLLAITNGGTSEETREVVLSTGTGEIARSSHRIPAGASVVVNATMSAAAAVHATLQPADALAEDDVIRLDLAALRRHPVAVDRGCPPALRAAISTHPALISRTDGGDVEAAVDCGTLLSGREVPSLRVLANRPPTTPRGSMQWSATVETSSRIRVAGESLQVAARLETQPADVVLLALGDEPLIVRRTGPSALIETSLDFASVAARRPETPLLLDFMFEQLLGGEFLNAIAMVDRGPAAALVAPVHQGDIAAQVRTAPDIRESHDVVRPLLLVAACLLSWEMIALARQGSALRAFARTTPSG